MQQYKVTLTGDTPFLMHADNIIFSDKVRKWYEEPSNKKRAEKGSDRSPAWTWIGYLYHNTKHVVIPDDNIMTMLRDGGAQITFSGKQTFKKQTQSGILVDANFDFYNNGKLVDMTPIEDLLHVNDFEAHLEKIKDLGFELLVKRAKIGTQKHIRVRPLFRRWSAVGSVTVLDENMYGITEKVLTDILTYAGALCGLGDWRPSSPKSGGSYGKFSPEIELIG